MATRGQPGFESAGIELHDSVLAAVETAGEDTVVRLAPAYIHRSVGVPGVDSGTVWSQDVTIVFRESRLSGSRPYAPTKLVDGVAHANGKRFINIIPFDNQIEGIVHFAFQLFDGSGFEIQALKAEFELAETATYLEEFPG